MNIDKITVVNSSFITFMYEIEEKFKEGYKLSTTDFPCQNMYLYEAFLEKEIEEKQPEQKPDQEQPVKKPRLSKEK